MRSRFSWLFALAMGSFLFLTSGLARAVSYPCTEAGIDSALAAGGVATFSCAAVTTVTVGTPKAISVNGTSLDGGGKLIVSGGDSVVPFQVNAGIAATIANLTIEHGKTGGYGSNLIVGGTLTLTNSTVQQGQDGGGGAIHVQGGGTLNASGVAIINNITGAEGAVAVHGTATFVNTTVSGVNFRGITARFGGQATVTYSTIVSGLGEDLFAVDAGSAVTVGHSILVAPPGTPSTAGAGTFNSLGYNMLSKTGVAFATASVTDQFDVQPVLAPLADNGGPTRTHAFMACSPGINAGNITGGPATDQRGQPRMQNNAIDVGAYESSLLPCLYIDDSNTTEGDSGTKPLTFPVRLSGKSTLSVSVGSSVTDGTATLADGDYTTLPSAIAMTPGSTSSMAALQINGDTKFEPNETLTVTLASPTNATIADGTAIGTITNDDTAPALSIGDVSVAEGTGGTTTVDVTVTLSGGSASTTTVSYATLDGTAKAGADFTAATGTLTFNPGVTTQKISIAINPDALKEGDEAFSVQLSNAVNASVSDAAATVTITDDEGNPGLSIGAVSIAEGNAGPVVATLAVTLSPASATAVTVDWSTVDGLATVADGDYAAGSGTLTFAPGETSKNLDVSITGDTKVETAETFIVRLANASGANIATADGTVTITNDDVAAEPDAGTDAGTDAGVDAGTDSGLPDDDAGATPDSGTTGGLDGGGTGGGNDASTTPPGASGDGGALGLGDGGLSITPGDGSSDDDCSVSAVGTSTTSQDFVLLMGPLAVALAFARRRRRR